MPPIKILFLAASPQNLTPVAVTEEHRTVQLALRAGMFHSDFQLNQNLHLRISELDATLREAEAQIVHFCCHGSIAGQVQLLDSQTDVAVPVPLDLIGTVMRLVAGPLRCVVLSACHTGRYADDILAAGIPFVIGMTTKVSTADCKTFCSAFYQSLASGENLQTAFELGKNRLKIEGLPAESLIMHVGQHQDPNREVLRLRSRSFISRSPYKGLRYFEAEDKNLFFGRAQLTAELQRTLAHQSFLMLTGASGCGKSSIVRASLIPRLKESLGERFRAIILKPGRSIGASLYSVLCNQHQVHDDRAQLVLNVGGKIVQQLFDAVRPKEESWLLFIDQFEEIFTLCPPDKESERRAFLQSLARFILETTAEKGGWVVVAMRADFIERFDAYGELAAALTGHLQLITQPSREELLDVVVSPAAQHGVDFEPGLAERIVDDAHGRPGALPLLSYTLKRLWEIGAPADGLTLHKDSYVSLGGVTGALAKRADAIYRYRDPENRAQQREPEEQQALRQLLLRLVKLPDSRSPQEEGFRITGRRAGLDEFSDKERALIRMLADEGLVVTSADMSADSGVGHGTVELAHEALLTAWQALSDWAQDAGGVMRLRERLSVDAETWDTIRQKNPKRAEAELWRGSRLDDVLEQQRLGEFALRNCALNERELRFLVDSQTLRTRDVRRVWWILIGTVAFLLVVGSIIGSKWREADQQRRTADVERQKAEQRELDVYVERGRQLLLSDKKPLEAALWLNKAYQQHAQNRALPYLLHEALRPVDALRLRLLGHTKTVNLAAYSPDGHWIVTCSDDKTARLWDAESGKTLFVLREHKGEVRGAAFSPDGSLIATAGEDKFAAVWEVESGALVLKVHGHKDGLRSVQFAPNGHRILTSSDDQTARVFDAESGTALLELRGHTGAVLSANYSPDGLRIVTASEDETIRIWEAATGTFLYSKKAGGGVVRAAIYSLDGRYLITASDDKQARVWDAETGLYLRAYEHQDWISSVAPSPDGRRIVTASYDRTAQIWDLSTGQKVNSLTGNAQELRSAGYSPDGRHIVTAGVNGEVLVQDSDLLSAYSLEEVIESVHPDAYSPDGLRIVAASDSNAARIWDARSGLCLRTLTGHGDKVKTAAFNPDGHLIVTASADHTARLWDADNGQLLRVLSGHSSAVINATFNPKGGNLVTVSDDHTARIWEVDTGRLIQSVGGPKEPIANAAWQPDGRTLVIAGSTSVRIWDVPNRTLMHVLKGSFENLVGAAMSPDGKQILGYDSAPKIMIWNASTFLPSLGLREESIHNVMVDIRVHSLSSTPSGQQVLPNGPKPGILPIGPEPGILPDGVHIIYSLDSGRILSMPAYGSFAVWSADSGQVLGRHNSAGPMAGLAFSPNGRQLLIGQQHHGLLSDLGTSEERERREISELLRCRIPFALEGNVVVPKDLESAACAQLPPIPEQPTRNSEVELVYWRGVNAWRNGDRARAEARFAEFYLACQRLGVSRLKQSSLLVSYLTRSDPLRPEDTRSLIEAVMALQKQMEPDLDDASARWKVLNALWVESQRLTRYEVALWAATELLALRAGDRQATARRQNTLLSLGKFSEVLREADTAFSASPQTDAISRLSIAARAWSAARLSGQMASRDIWRMRILAENKRLPEKAILVLPEDDLRDDLLHHRAIPGLPNVFDLWHWIAARQNRWNASEQSLMLILDGKPCPSALPDFGKPARVVVDINVGPQTPSPRH